MKYLSPEERSICTEVLNRALVGHLGLIDAAGYPRVIPLNFAYAKEHIYFHGGTHGEKYTMLAHLPKVTFSVDIPYSLIPSYWVNPERGCSITQFFKSVLIRGQGQLVETQEEKIYALQALMEKYQPEGNYTPFNHSSQIYAKTYGKVGIFLITVEDISVKYNFGQRLEPLKLDQILHKLKARDTALDRATLFEIHKWRSIQTA